MGVLNWISSLFAPAEKIIDELNYSGEEKDKIRNELANIQSQANTKFIELELAKVKAQSEIIKAESQSSNWLVQIWRPLASLTIVFLILLDGLGLAEVGSEIYGLATTFLGVYAGGRSIEKTAKSIDLGKNK